jgi:hypothetical protein
LPLADPGILISVKEAFCKIRKKKVNFDLIATKGETLKLFTFDGFSISVPNGR